MSGPVPILSFENRAALAAGVADVMAGAIGMVLDRGGRVRVALSGGGTPGPAYRLLAAMPLDWSRVDLALVDDRWVAPGTPGSNETLLREAFADASGVTIHPMWHGTGMIEEDAAQCEAAYARLRPFDLILLGMGGDAHTASWFPGSKGLAAALDPKATNTIGAVDATGCPGAQSWPHRLTLTLPPVREAGWIGLMLAGADKLAVLEQALDQDPATAPIRAGLEAAPDRTAIFFAD